MVKFVAIEYMPRALSSKEVERESEVDPELSTLREHIMSGNWKNCINPAFLAVKDELCVLGKLVLRGYRIVIPKSLQDTVLKLAHEGHPGIVKMKARLRTKVWFPRMDQAAEKFVKHCHSYQVIGQSPTPEPMKRFEPPSGPWQDLAIDLMEPKMGGEHILVLVDYYSRFYEVAVLKKATSESIIKALEPIFARFGYPVSLKSDNGAVFTSKYFQDYMHCCGIVHYTSPPFFPQANGEVEWQNRQLLKAIKASVAEGKQWQNELQQFLMMQRTTPHMSTGKTSAYLMFGRELKTKLPELVKEKQLIDEDIRDRDYENKTRGKLYADKKRNATEKDLTVGQEVLLQRHEKKDKLETKFETEPYTITDKKGHEVTIQSKDGAVYRR